MKPAMLRAMFVVCTCAASLAMAQTPSSADFAVRLPLQTTGDGLHVVELPEAVYRAAQARDLADLRIFNALDQALPIAFVLRPAPLVPTPTAIDLRLARLPAESEASASLLRDFALRLERDRERAVIEILTSSPAATAAVTPALRGYLIDARPLKDLKGRLVLSFASTADDYAGRVEISGSDDLVFWRPLTSGPLARSRRLGEIIERNHFTLERPPAFIRVAWSSKDVPDIERAQFLEDVAASVTLPRAQLAATLSDNRRSLYVDVPEALPITRLLVRVSELNRIVKAQVYRHDAAPPTRVRRAGIGPRRAEEQWQPIGSVEAFRLVRDGVEIEGAPLAVPVRTDGLRFDFSEPLDGAPPSIEAEWRPSRVVFAARAPGPYVLVAGRRDTPFGPALDARSVLAADDPAAERLPVATVEVGGAFTAQQQRALRIASEARWSRYVLWGVLMLAVAGLAWMAWRMSVQLRPSAVQTGDQAPTES
jgi:hypothetical protein